MPSVRRSPKIRKMVIIFIVVLRPCADFLWIDSGMSIAGQDILQDLVHNYRDEYKQLTAQELNDII
jgi:hypothetical protein